MTEEKLQVIVLKPKQLEFLRSVHEDSSHQGIDTMMERLSQVAYWVGMGKEVANHCFVLFLSLMVAINCIMSDILANVQEIPLTLFAIKIANNRCQQLNDD